MQSQYSLASLVKKRCLNREPRSCQSIHGEEMNSIVTCIIAGIALSSMVSCADCTEQEPVMEKLSSRAPLVLVPCGRGVDKQVRDNLHVITSNLQEIACCSSTHSNSHISDDWAALIRSVRALNLAAYRESTNRLDYVDIASFYDAVVSVAHVMVKEAPEETLAMLTSTFDAAIRISEYEAMGRFGRGSAKNFQTYRYGQADGRPEMLRSWAKEGNVFREMVRTRILPQWQHVINQPAVQSALNGLSQERRVVVLREIASMTKSIQRLTKSQNE